MAGKRSKRQIDRIKRVKAARGAKTGRFVVSRPKSGGGVGAHSGRVAPKARAYGGAPSPAKAEGEVRQQPRPKVPLLSGGKDPTLGERFEEELYRS
jgi:hypothetical protein